MNFFNKFFIYYKQLLKVNYGNLPARLLFIIN